MFQTVKKLARRYRQIGLVEPDDLVQEAMLRILRKRDGKYPTAGWLFKVVHSAAMDAGRDAKSERQYVFQDRFCDVGMVCERADEDSYLPWNNSYVVRESDVEIDLMPRLKKTLSKLSKEGRQVLMLYSEGYSYLEIARMTNSNIGTVRSRLHYARRRAKDLLGDIA